ncbi:LOW QUALITY PROTEIN: protease-associated domain-containing protein 1-like [Asterias rubens]|uniref:LOW QUALITY PROTEIN: protease-associated domain-containing protein 1-like n=1 Tax=Asterias rubens TaxID=7604 RepID=UPI001455D23F|nr:LOW QUALITY PROTEIN: protease-associated domain-containing protein 1-like [Asterias rubens]
MTHPHRSFWKSWNICFLVCSILFAVITHLHGHSVNENLFFSVLLPEDIAFLYKTRPAKDFGAVFTHNFERVYLVPTDPEDGCGELTNSLSIVGAFALVKRGSCSFMSKAITAERAGAVAVVIHDDNEKNDWSFIDMINDNTDRSTSIMLGRDGQIIKQSLLQNGMAGAVISFPVNITGIPLGLLKRSPWSLW